MLEYNIDDAGSLLTTNLEGAQKSLNDVERDIDFITEQCTTLEVGILIIY